MSLLDTNNFIVAFVGLPSAGKSSVINSLLGKRELQSGVCRTTKERNNSLETKILKDDKKNNFRVIDLPGICDSEESDDNFNKIAFQACTKADLIIWTSDVNKAFITTHELSEYNKLKEHLTIISNNTGKLYHFMIMLTKCDNEYILDNQNSKQTQSILASSTDSESEEIVDDFEDTNISDLINKVKEKIPIEDDIVLFNAFGRSYHHPKVSKVLKSFVEKLLGRIPKACNINFDISKYCKDFNIRQEEAYYSKLFTMTYDYLNSKIDLYTLIHNYWSNVSLANKLRYIDGIFFIININYTSKCSLIIYIFINLLNTESELSLKLLEKDANLKQLLLHTFNCIVDMIKYATRIIDKDINFLQDQYILYDTIEKSKCNTCLKHLLELILIDKKLLILDGKIIILKYLFSILPDDQEDIIRKFLLMEYDYILSTEYVIYFLKSLDITDSIIKYIKNIFNDFILDNNTNYQNFIKKIEQGIKYEHKNFKIDANETILTRANRYLDYLRELSDNELYILMNKLQVLSHMYRDVNNLNILFNKELSRNDLGFSMNRIKHNYNCTDVIDKIWNKIYSNILFDYNGDFTNFVPLDKTELLYMIENSD